MKKIVSLLLILVLCLGCFVGCAEENATETPDASGKSAEQIAVELEKAAEFLKLMYKDTSPESSAAYTVPSQVFVDGTVRYPITWTTNVSEDIVKITVSEDGKTTTIGINESLAEDTAYTLTATFKGEDGQEKSVVFERKIVSVKKIIDAAFALQPGESLEGEQMLKGTISAVNTPYDSGYGNITVTIQVKGFEDKPIKCYRLKGDGAEGLKVGDIIVVSGTIDNYNGTVEFAQGCQIAEIVFSAEPEPEAPSVSGTFTKITELNDGDKIVIVNPASNKAFSMTKNGYYNNGIDVAGENFDSITGEEVLVAKKNEDGTWGFATESGKKLAMGAEFSSMNETGEHDIWTLEDAGDGNFYLKNNGRDLYLEWYASKNNWSGYNPSELNQDYVLAFYKLA